MPGSPGTGSKFPNNWTELDVLEAGYQVSNRPGLRPERIGRQRGFEYYRGSYRGVNVRVQVNPATRAIHSVARE
jgi:hypothetical protein